METNSMFDSNEFYQILAIHKFADKVGAFTKEYLREHFDEIDNVYIEFKYPNPSFSEIKERKKFFNNQEQIFEAIVKRRLQSGEDEILYRFSLVSEKNKKDEKHN